MQPQPARELIYEGERRRVVVEGGEEPANRGRRVSGGRWLSASCVPRRQDKSKNKNKNKIKRSSGALSKLCECCQLPTVEMSTVWSHAHCADVSRSCHGSRYVGRGTKEKRACDRERQQQREKLEKRRRA